MFDLFADILGEENVLLNEPMKNHTTFRIGGNADYFLRCSTAEEVIAVVRLCKENGIKYFILGNGSNILVGDLGIRGAVISFDSCFDELMGEDGIFEAGAGVLLSKIASVALKNSYTGMERLSGIPGSVGGAIYMNAGAYGDEICDVTESVTYIDENLNIVTAKAEDCGFAYRESMFTNSDKIIVSVKLKLCKGNYDEIKALTKEYTEKRVSKQPIEKFSAGSTFKRPKDNFAGTLIEQCGLKGRKVGDAEVSVKHAGFVINNKNATANDVLKLIEIIKSEVYNKTGVLLEPEVKMVGEFERMNL